MNFTRPRGKSPAVLSGNTIGAIRKLGAVAVANQDTVRAAQLDAAACIKLAVHAHRVRAVQDALGIAFASGSFAVTNAGTVKVANRARSACGVALLGAAAVYATGGVGLALAVAFRGVGRAAEGTIAGIDSALVGTIAGRRAVFAACAAVAGKTLGRHGIDRGIDHRVGECWIGVDRCGVGIGRGAALNHAPTHLTHAARGTVALGIANKGTRAAVEAATNE